MTSKDNDGLTPLDIAKENRNEECIRLLFKAQKPEILVSGISNVQTHLIGQAPRWLCLIVMYVYVYVGLSMYWDDSPY